MSSGAPYPCTKTGHLVRFYGDETSLHGLFAEFIGAGLAAGGSAVVIPTLFHRQALGQEDHPVRLHSGIGAAAIEDDDVTATTIPSARARSDTPLRLQGVRVLVVEDEQDAREFVGALLESRGASVRLTASAAEAYVSLDESLPDVILSDIGMPGEDGYSFARRLRSFPRERGGVTPIVALTAYTSAQDRRRALDAGYDYHLPKPVDSEELIRVLDRLAREPSARA
jgi:CheY-like chemotaxis protein